jgi:hypothetical protein
MAAFAKARPIRKSPRESQASSGRSSDRREERQGGFLVVAGL